MTAPVLQLTAVKKSFGRTEIIRGATVDVREGEIHALIGPNGAGKSTLFHLVSGRLAPSSGSIRYRGRAIEGRRPSEIARLGLRRSFQQTSAFPDLTVAENVAIAALSTTGLAGSPFRAVRGLSAVWQRVEEVLDLLNLRAFHGTQAGDLAYSEQRALEIALCVATNPDLILLDEPTAGMSRAETGRMTQIIRTIAQGRTLVLVEHDMNVVFGLAQTVSVLVYGEVIASGPPDEVRGSATVRAAYLGKAERTAHP